MELKGPVLALDVGGKRTGMAISDENCIFAFPMETIETHLLIEHLEKIALKKKPAALVLGIPLNLKSEATQGTPKALQVKERILKKFPDMPIYETDERFTSSIARQAMVMGGMKKKDREKKENTDKLSATLILQSFLEQLARFGWEGIRNKKP
jgi:putative Holliday junction resolvase